MGEEVLDLFGHPVVFARPRGRGRPQHVPTVENHDRILLMAATGHGEEACAAAVRISVPTMRRHYFSAVSQFAQARLIAEGERLAALHAAQADGNVAAMKELGRLYERAGMPGGSKQAKVKPPKKGKKEEALDAARNMGAGDDSKWGFLGQPN